MLVKATCPGCATPFHKVGMHHVYCTRMCRISNYNYKRSRSRVYSNRCYFCAASMDKKGPPPGPGTDDVCYPCWLEHRSDGKCLGCGEDSSHSFCRDCDGSLGDLPVRILHPRRRISLRLSYRKVLNLPNGPITVGELSKKVDEICLVLYPENVATMDISRVWGARGYSEPNVERDVWYATGKILEQLYEISHYHRMGDLQDGFVPFHWWWSKLCPQRTPDAAARAFERFKSHVRSCGFDAPAHYDHERGKGFLFTEPARALAAIDEVYRHLDEEEDDDE